MIKFEYKKPLAKGSDLNSLITFYESVPNEGPEPGEDIENTLYTCWANVKTVWMKDHEQAKTNGTMEDLTIIMRDAQGQFVPDNKHHISVTDFIGKKYNVKSVQPDLRDKRFIIIVAGLNS